MRRAALALVALLVVPTALAAEAYRTTYVMSPENGFGGGGALVRNGARFFPSYGLANVSVAADDVAATDVRIRLCHEWTYDDGSHPDVRCVVGCGALDDALTYPPWRDNMTYRVIVDLRGEAAPCPAKATAGQLRVTFT